ncbi:hypothetical protein DPMN_094452 [Dreissena polymorpha]|uniref:Uncharacterized protein n=1 Tax=Dreissena polymorpha TaxID=45954 RepID=A0A9D4L624_DREPO|nr:hypothetical protein DPMN_094452 [Dreissena polymorpha]
MCLRYYADLPGLSRNCPRTPLWRLLPASDSSGGWLEGRRSVYTRLFGSIGPGSIQFSLSVGTQLLDGGTCLLVFLSGSGLSCTSIPVLSQYAGFADIVIMEKLVLRIVL